MAQSGLAAAAALDQVAYGYHHEHQQVGGEDGHQCYGDGMASGLALDLVMEMD
ncbi:hypothetical protein [Aeromonas bestiarum]|uniref:hypothetical protein n=1 Tax=Aeromonas bestiarum TaxID=105751 RepID=UPI003D20F07C